MKVEAEWSVAGDYHVGELFANGAPLRRPNPRPDEPGTYMVANHSRARAETDVAVILRQALRDGVI